LTPGAAITRLPLAMLQRASFSLIKGKILKYKPKVSIYQY
jgi:hypothetical protein